MAQNVSYANNYTDIESLILHILPSIGPEIAAGTLNSNLVTTALKTKGAIEEVEGGLEKWSGIFKNSNSNFKMQGKNEEMSANVQDPAARLRWDWKIFTGSIVKNDLDDAMNKGEAMIKQYVRTLTQHAKDTIGNQFNSYLWNTNPGADEFPSIPQLISATPTTGTIGGLNRSAGTYLQNQVYPTAIADIGSEAGIADMERLRITSAVGQQTPDLIVMDTTRFANLVAYLQTERRYAPDDAMGKMGFTTIQLGSAIVGFENLTVMGGENTIPAGYMYGINTKVGLKIAHLKQSGSEGWATDWERVNKTLNKALYYNWFGTPYSPNPRANFVATNLS